MDRLLNQAGGAPVDGWAITSRDPSPFDGGCTFLLRDAGRIRLVRLLTGEHLPADPDHLVGQRDHRDLPVPARLDLPQPRAERRLITLQVQERGLGALDKELPQVRVPAFADPSEGRRAARGGLARDDSRATRPCPARE